MSTEHRLQGSIAGAGFASGDRVVVGQWDASPIGPFGDVMWAEADDWRTLFVADERSREFVTAVYEFDAVIVVPDLKVVRSKRRLEVCWHNANLEFDLGRAAPFPPRPAWLTKHVERPIAKRTMHVETHGVSPSGVIETYRASKLRRIIGGWAVVAGRDLGEIGPPTPACRFGFSEPPPFASVTDVTAILTDPTGTLDAVLQRSV